MFGCRSPLRSFLVSFCLIYLPTTGTHPIAAQMLDPDPATVPTDRLSEGWWAARHQAVLAEVKAHPEAPLLLIGDSITNNYDKASPPNSADENFQPTWQKFYGSRGALNLGFSGDATEHVLWRLRHGEVQGLHPKVAVVLIGTNNTGHENQSAEQTGVGIDAVVAELEQRLPETHILLLGLLPSDVSTAKSARDAAVNRYLANGYGENKRVTYLDIGTVFLRDGVLDKGSFYDPRLAPPGGALHPDTGGQRRMAEAVEPTLAKWMGEAPRTPLAAMTDVDTALIPVDWLEQDSYDWYARHHAVLAQGPKLEPEIVLIGDSITHFWAGPPTAIHVNGALAWKQAFGAARVLNLGFGWDRTQNVLWRLRQGELDGLAPKWVVVNVGTNNLTGTSHARASTPAETAAGVKAVVEQVRQRCPAAKVLVMAIFPRGMAPDSELRAPIAETNRRIEAEFAGSAVRVLDIGQRFVLPDGTLPKAMMPDGTHPSEAGYAVWAQALVAAGVHP